MFAEQLWPIVQHACAALTAGRAPYYTSSANGHFVPSCVPPLSKLQAELEEGRSELSG